MCSITVATTTALRISDLRESDSTEQMKHTLSFVEHYLFKLRNGKKRVSIPILKKSAFTVNDDIEVNSCFQQSFCQD